LVKIFLLVQVNSKIEPLNSQYRNKFQTNKLAERFLAPQISFEIILPPILILNTVHPPICHIFISQKSVDKSGFVDKSGEM